MIGIYKITSPTGRIYIGQSINIELRIKAYEGALCKSQPKLYRSILKHGFKNHSFEVLEECLEHELNDKERYYQDLFDCMNKGLNCKLTGDKDRSGKLSSETKLKISNSHKGKTMSIESVIKSKIGLRKRYENGYSNPRKNVKMSNETKLKLSASRTGTKLTEAHKEKIRLSLIGNKRMLGKKLSETHKLNCKLNATKYKSKLVLDIQNGIFYDSAKELSDLSGIPHSTLRGKLNGSNTNNTNYIYA